MFPIPVIVAVQRPKGGPTGIYTYLRPDGTSHYLRPDGTSTYKRP